MSISSSQVIRKLRTSRLDWKPITFVGQKALQDGVPHGLGQHLPVVGGGPGDVDELLQGGVGHQLPDPARRQVELVVLDQDQRHLALLQPAVARRRAPGGLDDAVGEHPVDLHVALSPRPVGVAVDGGVVAEVPEGSAARTRAAGC